MNEAVLVVLSRWFHVLSACLALGGLVVMRLILPAGLKLINSEEERKQVFLRCRKIFKMLIHTCILLLLVTGTYNTLLNWQAYKGNMPLTHALFGMHGLLALIAFSLALWILSGAHPPAAHAKVALVNVIVLMLVVLAGSSLKYAKEHPKNPAPTTVDLPTAK